MEALCDSRLRSVEAQLAQILKAVTSEAVTAGAVTSEAVTPGAVTSDVGTAGAASLL